MTHTILILGGTTEARLLAAELAREPGLAVTLSLAGRTIEPARQPVPVRRGGFGGAAGLAAYLTAQSVALMIDATHPYAARISENASLAAAVSGVAAFALVRTPWRPVEGDRWRVVADAGAAAAALGAAPRRVFLTLGRQEAAAFEEAPQHAYWVRSVDPIEPPLGLPMATPILARGPFDEIDERRFLFAQRIDAVVAKNSGGSATYGKIAAARGLGIEVILLARPPATRLPAVDSVEAAVAAVRHRFASAWKRGV